MMRKDLNRHFIEEDIWMVSKYMRRCSTSLGIRERQIKTMMRYHQTPIRMARIGDTDKNKCWQKCGAQELSDIAGGKARWHSYSGKIMDAGPLGEWLLEKGRVTQAEDTTPGIPLPSKGGKYPFSVERSGDHSCNRWSNLTPPIRGIIRHWMAPEVIQNLLSSIDSKIFNLG